MDPADDPAQATNLRPNAHPEPASPAAVGVRSPAAARPKTGTVRAGSGCFVVELKRELHIELPETFPVTDDEIDLFSRLFGVSLRRGPPVRGDIDG